MCKYVWRLGGGGGSACLYSTDSSTPLQPPTRDSYMLEEVKETQLTREEVMECLPLDLHQFVIIHNFEEDFASYPALSKDDENLYPKELWASHAGLSILLPIAVVQVLSAVAHGRAEASFQ